MKKIVVLAILALAFSAGGQTIGWPTPAHQAKPYTRWWWLGSAVDSANILYNMQSLADKGIGGVEITPLYGVQGNDANNISFLSPRWMQMLRYIESEGKRMGVEVNMNTGTGWPFGGPQISIDDAASRVLFQTYAVSGGARLSEAVKVNERRQKNVAKLSRLMAFCAATGKKVDLTSKVDTGGMLQWTAPAGPAWTLVAAFCGKTLQMVKRAAPGGEGYVMDHFSKSAVQTYLKRFDDAFGSTQTQYPPVFFNDSYEVFGADWTPNFFDEFAKRRGYKLEEYLPVFLALQGFADDNKRTRLITDYRETMSELLLENFTQTWTAWAHAHGSTTRNQAHGSPGNLLDLYGAVDVPECESFGISDFGIKGLRRDSLTKPNDSDLSMLKYASSAAHVTGKPFTSSETFTWLTEHFRTSLSQCKPDLDLFFLAGVNHVYFHGTPYSPREAAWPGWRFYASVNMSPTNSIWRDAEAMFRYIERVQSFMQLGVPDNDFLLYLPIYDIWKHENRSHYLQFAIHDMKKRAPKFIDAVEEIMSCGFDVDYISDRQLLRTSVDNGQLRTQGGTRYKAIVVPNVEVMPAATIKALAQLARDGATVIFVGQYPSEVPGLQLNGKKQKELDDAVKALPVLGFDSSLQGKIAGYGKGKICTGATFSATVKPTKFQPERLHQHGLSYIRRATDDGHIYFISNLSSSDHLDRMVEIAAPAKSVIIYNPMNGTYGKSKVDTARSRSGLYRYFLLNLRSGESAIVRTFSNKDVPLKALAPMQYVELDIAITLNSAWEVKFIESEPEVLAPVRTRELKSWTDLFFEHNAKIAMGTALYTTQFYMPKISGNEGWMLDLGDVRESARVRLNGHEVGTLWAVPYWADVSQYLREGTMNTLEVEVTNTPANLIADYDRRGVNWRIFNEINFVDIKYRRTKYGHWAPMPSGLLGPVKLVQVASFSNAQTAGYTIDEGTEIVSEVLLQRQAEGQAQESDKEKLERIAHDETLAGTRPAWTKDVGARFYNSRTGNIIDVRNMGAVGDAKTLCTQAIQRAIDTCAAHGGGRVNISNGRYLTGALFLKSNVELHFDGATLLAVQDVQQFSDIPTRVAGVEMAWPAAVVNVIGQTNVAVTGQGTIDGQGKYLWDKYWSMRKDYDARKLRWIVDYDCKRVRSMLIQNSDNVTVSDVEFRNSGFWTVQVLYSSRCTLSNLRIRNNEDGHGPSTDGLDIDSSEKILIRGCDIDCNDDNICLKAGRDADGLRVNRPTRYVFITECTAQRGAGLVTCGSETSGGISHIYCDNSRANGTSAVLRIKSAFTRGGTVDSIYVGNVFADKVRTLVSCDMNWNPSYSYSTLPDEYKGKALPAHWTAMLTPVPPDKGLPTFRNITLNNVNAVNTGTLVRCVGSEKSLIENVTISNVNAEAASAGEVSYTKNFSLRNTTLKASKDAVLKQSNNVNADVELAIVN